MGRIIKKGDFYMKKKVVLEALKERFKPFKDDFITRFWTPAPNNLKDLGGNVIRCMKKDFMSTFGNVYKVISNDYYTNDEQYILKDGLENISKMSTLEACSQRNKESNELLDIEKKHVKKYRKLFVGALISSIIMGVIPGFTPNNIAFILFSSIIEGAAVGCVVECINKLRKSSRMIKVQENILQATSDQRKIIENDICNNKVQRTVFEKTSANNLSGYCDELSYSDTISFQKSKRRKV